VNKLAKEITELAARIDELAEIAEKLQGRVADAEEIVEVDKQINPSYYVFCPRQPSVGKNAHVNVCLKNGCSCPEMEEKLASLYKK
jgi:hypothetical protein